jgi:formamidopyrimidine-DNA glycosylase
MPELPDVTVYVEALEARVLGQPLEQLRVGSPFVLRSVDPPLTDAAGRRVTSVRRLGKRIVLALEPDLFLILHLMIAGRLRWRPRGAVVPRGRGLAALDFPTGTVLFTEEGKKHRAGLWLVRGEAGLAAHDRGGLEPLEVSLADFGRALRRERHTLKRSLTDPTLFSGIGNAYSDEILHAARLSPLQLSTNLDDDEIARLYEAMRATLVRWTERLRAEAGEGFPEKVTAFREGMAVHGRYNQPCPVCGSPVQRIRYAENEVNYCAACQTGGRLLADRALSRLLREDWPRSIDELDALRKSPDGVRPPRS